MGLEKLQIKVEHTGEQFSVLFNPEEYTVNKENKFSSQEVPGLSGPIVQFVSGGQKSLDMKLFFDTYAPADPAKAASLDKVDVRNETRKITRLLDIDPKLHAPPIVNLSWATLQLRCVLVSVNQQFVMFMPDGRPVRAWLTVKFNEVIDPAQESAKVKRETADFHKIHTVIDGETLSGIAGQLYADPRQWRPIAIANAITDPRTLFVGQRLRIPSLPYNDPATGEAVR